MQFNVIAERTVTIDPGAPADPIPTFDESRTPAGIARMRRAARQAAFDRARLLPGFEGYSLRKGCDVVVNGEHVALDLRLFAN
jgi:hypothetical protein